TEPYFVAYAAPLFDARNAGRPSPSLLMSSNLSIRFPADVKSSAMDSIPLNRDGNTTIAFAECAPIGFHANSNGPSFASNLLHPLKAPPLLPGFVLGGFS